MQSFGKKITLADFEKNTKRFDNSHVNLFAIRGVILGTWVNPSSFQTFLLLKNIYRSSELFNNVSQQENHVRKTPPL